MPSMQHAHTSTRRHGPDLRHLPRQPPLSACGEASGGLARDLGFYERNNRCAFF